MSDDDDDFDDLPSLSPSPQESEDPISDVNPDEMAKLMADLDDMDNDIFKSGNKKQTVKKGSPDERKSKENKPPPKHSKPNNSDDDWDIDNDLLNFDNKEPTKEKKGSIEKKKEAALPSKVKTSPLRKSIEDIPNTPPKTPAKTPPPKPSTKASPKVNKSKFMTDLFSEEPSKERNKGASDSVVPKKDKPKNKLDISFDADEESPLDMVSKTKESEPGYLDSLLGTSSVKKPEKKSTSEFLLPDQYKSSFPKSEKPKSSDPIDDLFGDSSARLPRRRTATRQNKSFEIDDDDILSGSKSKGQRPKSSKGDEEERKREGRKSAKEDWLFGSPAKTSGGQVEHEKESKTQEGSGDWLNQLLTTEKSSPSVQRKASQGPPAVKQSKHEEEPNPMQTVTNPSSSSNMSAFTIPELNKGYLSSQMADQQTKSLTEASTMASQLQMQQQKMQAEMMQQFQSQMQEQQQRLALLMSQQTSALPSFVGTLGSGGKLLGEDEESLKKLKIDLHKAQAEAGRMEAELTVLKEQHENEVQILTQSFKKEKDLEEELWKKKEESILHEKDSALQSCQKRIDEIIKEKEYLINSYEEKLASVKKEMTETMERSKEMYSNVIERMKSEHQTAIDRLTDLKEVELRAMLSATGRVKEVESVLGQLETNTANLSEITNSLELEHKSAIDMTKRSLEMKEKQLKEMEANLGIVRAESESERNRLTILVNRLEASLSNQGTESETQKWVLAQERMKLEAERTALIEEKRHFQSNMQTERRELARSKESLLTEQKEMMRTVARQKAQANDFPFKRNKTFVEATTEMEVIQLQEEKKILEEKLSKLKFKEEEILEEKRSLEAKKLKLEQEHLQNLDLKEMIEQKSSELEMKSNELNRREENLERENREIQSKLNEAIQATQKLTYQQEALARERTQLELSQEEANRLMAKNLCVSCRSNLNPGKPVTPLVFARIPGDGSEIHSSFSPEKFTKKYDPASVLSRLKAAREEEIKLREQRRTPKRSIFTEGLS